MIYQILANFSLFFSPTIRHHLSVLRSKLSKALFQLRSAKNFLAKESLTLLYYAIFHSHLAYATIIWSSAPQSVVNNNFELQKKKTIRIISNSKYNAHTEPIISSLYLILSPFSNCSLFTGL
jgi:hypothetical protein